MTIDDDGNDGGGDDDDDHDGDDDEDRDGGDDDHDVVHMLDCFDQKTRRVPDFNMRRHHSIRPIQTTPVARITLKPSIKKDVGST